MCLWTSMGEAPPCREGGDQAANAENCSEPNSPTWILPHEHCQRSLEIFGHSQRGVTLWSLMRMILSHGWCMALQNSLGGNARTAIISTMSPTHTHAEQTRNTLSFATRAKEVVNKAEVNVVIDDKLLVKQLQKEVARLEAETRTPEAVALSMSTEALLLAMDLEIERMVQEIIALQVQRDAALGELAAQVRVQAEQKRSQDVALSVSRVALLLAKEHEVERMAAEIKELQMERDAAQQELAERVRSEAQCKSREVALPSMSTEALLLAKDLEIERMATEIRDLQMQLDVEQGEAAGRARVGG